MRLICTRIRPTTETTPAHAGSGSSIGAVVRGAADAASGGMRHAVVPFQSIVHELLPRRQHDSARNDIFQAMLALSADTASRIVPPLAIAERAWIHMCICRCHELQPNQRRAHEQCVTSVGPDVLRF